MENLLNLLPLLACPVGMGLMMWLMMGRNRRQDMGSTQAPTVEPSPEDRLAQLRAQLDEVQTQQAAIAAQIARLSAAGSPAPPAEATGAEIAEPAPARRHGEEETGRRAR